MILTAILVLVRFGSAARLLSDGIAAVGYPFELDVGEGVVLTQTMQLLSGHPLYQPIEHAPFLVTVYPPVFHLLTAAVSTLIGNGLAAGRVLSLSSTILTAAIAGTVVWRASDLPAPPLTRGLSALLAALSFLSVSYTAVWAPLMRIDMCAHLLAWCGVLIFVRLAPHTRACWSAIPFLLAVYTRQSSVAAPAACLLVALVLRPVLAVKLATWLAAGGLSTFALLTLWTHGQFYFHVVKGVQTAFDWHRLLWYLSDLRLRYPTEIAVALVSTRSLFRRSSPERASRAVPPSLAAPRPPTVDWARPVLGTYLFTAFLIALTVGKVGSEVNYLVEFMAVVCVCAAVALGDALAEAGAVSPRAGASAPAVLLAALLLAPALGMHHGPATERIEIPNATQQSEMRHLVELLRHTDGPVLSQTATSLIIAGKPVEYQSCDALAQLARLGWWDPTEFIARIEHQYYRLIILGADAGTMSESICFTAPMRDSIHRRYAAAETIGPYRIYRPA